MAPSLVHLAMLCHKKSGQLCHPHTKEIRTASSYKSTSLESPIDLRSVMLQTEAHLLNFSTCKTWCCKATFPFAWE